MRYGLISHSTENVEPPVNDGADRKTVNAAGKSVENAKTPALDKRNLLRNG